MPSTGNKFCNATILQLCRVVESADALYGVVAEFPDEPACWAEDMDALDSALEDIPGTSAYYHATQKITI